MAERRPAATATFKGSVLGKPLDLKENGLLRNAYSVGFVTPPGSTVPTNVDIRTGLAQIPQAAGEKPGYVINLHLPTIPFAQYNFEALKALLSPGPKRLAESYDRGNLLDFDVRTRPDFEFWFTDESWNTGNNLLRSVTTLGNQTGSELRVLALAEVFPPANAPYARMLEVTCRLNGNLYDSEDQLVGRAEGVEFVFLVPFLREVPGGG
ncbi:MAG: hypothetical protein MUC97_17520 [Bernardetiaceae bacterium]|nr:hypothetical protein [Bernardetiaceae bacterium]